MKETTKESIKELSNIKVRLSASSSKVADFINPNMEKLGFKVYLKTKIFTEKIEIQSKDLQFMGRIMTIIGMVNMMLKMKQGESKELEEIVEDFDKLLPIIVEKHKKAIEILEKEAEIIVSSTLSEEKMVIGGTFSIDEGVLLTRTEDEIKTKITITDSSGEFSQDEIMIILLNSGKKIPFSFLKDFINTLDTDKELEKFNNKLEEIKSRL